MTSEVLGNIENVINTWPLTSEQEEEWLMEQLYPESPSHSIRCIYRLTGMLNIEALDKSINAIISRHDSLRTYFPVVAEVPVQVIRPFEPIHLPLRDLSHLPESDWKEQSESLIRDITQPSFDRSKDRLFRVLLIKHTAEAHILAVVFDHIIFDGWSKHVFQVELSQLYKMHTEGGVELLKPLPLQYTEFALKQKERNTIDFQERDLNYWKKQLSGELPELNLVADYPKTSQTSLTREQYNFWLSGDKYHKIKSLCHKENMTKFILFLTVTNVMLQRYTGQEDIMTCCPVSGRNEAELESLMGLFVKTLVIRTQITEEMTAREALHRVRAVFEESSLHQNIPFSKLVSELTPSRDLSTRPSFQFMLNKINMPREYEEIQGLVMEDIDNEASDTIVDITMRLIDSQGKLNCSFIYSKDVFKQETIARMAGHFQALLGGFLQDLDQPISMLPILTADERHRLLYESNVVQPAYPQDSCIHELFEQQVHLHPDWVALSDDSIEMTYAELERSSNQLANRLRQSGLFPEGLVGVCLDRSPAAIVSFLGILKAGGAYVPIDSTYPAERITLMLEDAKVHTLITTESLFKQLPSLECQTIFMDKDLGALTTYSDECPQNISTPQSLAYVIYTSGSTGKPKGVAVPHQGIIRLVVNSGFLKMGPEETFLQLTSISFDPSGLEIYGSLLNGGRVAILGANKPSLKHIADTIQKQRVTILNSNPDLVNLLLDGYSEEIQGLHQVISGGDILPVWLAKKFLEKMPESQLINVYGPTENAVITTSHSVKHVSGEASISIGSPIANDTVYILDKHLQPVPIGVVGELYLSGEGVARGYLNNDALTEQKFIPNPFIGTPGSKLYKTGDLARFRPDKSIDFLGRIDHQVKIRGCRIELGEVEVALCAYTGVIQAVTSAWKSDEGVHKLVAYVVMQKDLRLDQQGLRSFLQERLPNYMVPTFFVELEQIPVTSVGKIDRKRLPSPIPAQQKEEEMKPRNEIEEKLVRIWERLLKVSPISVQDNFFDLGGHSLMAMQLFSEIENAFMKRLPVSIIFHEDTVEKLAKLVHSNESKDLVSSLVAMQPRGTKAPLYCVHELGGEVISYWNLAQKVGEDQPVYGIRYAANDDASQITLQELAGSYLNDIRKIQPHGPYSLLGYSLGGLIAYEMAQQLYEMKEEVSLLAIVDARNPARYPSDNKQITKRIVDNMRILFKLPGGIRTKFMKEKVYNALVKRDLLSNSPGQEAEDRARGFMKLVKLYKPRPYPGKMTFFRAEHDYSNYILDDKNGWESVGEGSIEVYKVPSDHLSILNEQNVVHILNPLSRYL